MNQHSLHSRRLSPCVLGYIARNFLTPYIGAIIGFMALFMLVDSINGDMRDFLEANTKTRRLMEMQAAEAAQPTPPALAQPESNQTGAPGQANTPGTPAATRQPKLIPWSVIITYLLAKQPQNLTYVIPFACLLAASFMTMVMGKNSELTALRAAGLSLFTCCIPVWIAAALSCIAMLGINESWGPA